MSAVDDLYGSIMGNVPQEVNMGSITRRTAWRKIEAALPAIKAEAVEDLRRALMPLFHWRGPTIGSTAWQDAWHKAEAALNMTYEDEDEDAAGRRFAALDEVTQP